MTPSFVLIHGANGNSFTFAPLQSELALLGYRSLAVDLPGHGFAAAFPAAYQAPQDAEADALTPGNRFDVRSLDAAHVEPLIRPEGLAAVLASLV